MINKLEVEGYRLLDGFSAVFGDLTIVIGANATGKSTLIGLLQFVSRTAEFPLKDVVGWEGGLVSLLNAVRRSEKISWEVTFHKPLQHPQLSRIPLADNQSYVYEVTIGMDLYHQPVAHYELLRAEKPYETYDKPLKFLEATRNKSSIYSATEHRLVPFDEVVGEETRWLFPESQQEGLDLRQKPAEEVSEEGKWLRLARMRFYNEYPILSWARFLLSHLQSYPGFDVGHSSKLRTQPADIQPLTVLQPTGENLGTVLHEVLTRADYRTAAEEIRDFLRAAYPFVDDVFAETTPGVPAKVLVRLREHGMQRSTELWELSDGMLRFLCLAVALLNPVPPPFIAIDEPEVGLHPRLLPIVADVIKAACERTQVLVTTHSPDLLNCFNLDSVAVMVREEGKARWERPGTNESLKKMLQTVTADSLGDLHRSGELEAL